MNSDGNLEKATDNAAQLAAQQLKEKGLSADKLYQHHDWSGKNCPSQIRAGKPYDWSTFKSKVAAYYNGSTSASKPGAGTGSGSNSSKKTVSQLADEVIAGKWGNGTARKEALESAGYDYAAVQAEVDRRYGVTSTTEKCDDILTVGSVVTSKPMSIKAVNGSAIKYVDGVECVNIPDLGGWFPTKYVSEYDASDGKKDNYLANTKAKVYLDNATVEAIDIPNNLAKIHGIWCKADPMIEIKEGK